MKFQISDIFASNKANLAVRFQNSYVFSPFQSSLSIFCQIPDIIERIESKKSVKKIL